MKFKIISVDHNGYNGRENHPSDSDIGLIVVALRMDSNYGDDSEPTITNGAVNGIFNAEDIEYCWVCSTDDGRLLELMSHEVRLLDE